MVPSNVSTKTFQFDGIGRINNGWLDLEELQEALARYHGLLDCAVERAKEVEGTLKLGQVRDDGEPITGSPHASRDLPAAHYGRDNSAQVENEGLADIHEDHSRLNLGLGLLENLNLGAISIGFVFFCVEVLDRLIAGDGVILHRFLFTIGIGHLSSLIGSSGGHLDGHVEIPASVHQIQLSVEGTEVEVEDGN